MSVTDLGLAWGGNRQTAQFWEKGTHLPPAREIPKLCRLLLIDANHLLGFDLIDGVSERDLSLAKQALLVMAQTARENKKSRRTAPIAPTKRARRKA